jgi:hypothetical protein
MEPMELIRALMPAAILTALENRGSYTVDESDYPARLDERSIRVSHVVIEVEDGVEGGVLDALTALPALVRLPLVSEGAPYLPVVEGWCLADGGLLRYREGRDPDPPRSCRIELMALETETGEPVTETRPLEMLARDQVRRHCQKELTKLGKVLVPYARALGTSRLLEGMAHAVSRALVEAGPDVGAEARRRAMGLDPHTFEVSQSVLVLSATPSTPAKAQQMAKDSFKVERTPYLVAPRSDGPLIWVDDEGSETVWS